MPGLSGWLAAMPAPLAPRQLLDPSLHVEQPFLCGVLQRRDLFTHTARSVEVLHSRLEVALRPLQLTESRLVGLG